MYTHNVSERPSIIITTNLQPFPLVSSPPTPSSPCRPLSLQNLTTVPSLHHTTNSTNLFSLSLSVCPLSLHHET